MTFKINKTGKIVVSSTTKFTSIHLHQYEISLLMQVVKCIKTPSDITQKYFKEIRLLNGCDVKDEDKNRKNTANRLMKFKKSGLLKYKHFDAAYYLFDHKNNYYTFTSRTLEVLYALQLINDEELRYYKRILKQSSYYSQPSVHHSAICKTINEVDIIFRKTHHTVNYQIIRGSIDPLFKDTKHKEYAIFPDAVINLPDYNKVIAIEIDGGKQQQEVIRSKYEHYKQLTAKMPNIDLDVLFIPIDHSLFENLITSPKFRRIQHLKTVLPDSDQGNLDVFVMKFLAVEQYIDQLVNDTPDVLMYYNQLKQFLVSKNMLVRDVAVDDQLLVVNDPDVMSNKLLCLKSKDVEEQYCLLVHMKNGSVKDYKRYNLLKNNLKKFDKDAKLVLIYNTKIAYETDVIGKLDSNTEVSTLDTLKTVFSNILG